jgi:hypothetical protein
MTPALQNSYPSMFGINWRSTYEEQLIFNSSDLFANGVDAVSVTYPQ